MMTSLFSSFDPCSSSNLFNNWLSTLMFILIFPSTYWMINNRFSILMKNIINTLHNEFKLLIGTHAPSGSTLLFIGLLMLIAINNFLGLFPYIFTSTSHLVTAISLAAPLWLAFMLYGWVNNMKFMFAHLVPLSTPNLLMPFMVLIESISNIIRPGTLAVRLSANMIAGHLLLTLLGNQTSASSSFILIIMLFIQILLLLLESAVALIQAYVFAVLSSLYSSEVVAH
uniref:ATP synthase subunit a n=1 Tax=Friesea antarctica TaxID=2720488 RepID=B2BSE2_9HEXA|nr:ATP synthase F0 subunit 6 [Friesea antarctica]ABS57595.1 ATP synthase F0 subunit 6 [Friesea antarctica]